jgi:hypothetical protein
MTRFTDGPAQGKHLWLRRAPRYLRVVRDVRTGAVDALDQLDDKPGPDEEVFVYERDADAVGTIHLDRVVNGRRRGEWYSYADYRHVPDAPVESLREADAWRAWAAARAAADKAADANVKT